MQPLYTEHPDSAGRAAVAWMKENLPAESRIITRDSLWADLHEPGLGGPAYPDAHSHWKVAADPAIRQAVFHNDWHNVDYLVMTSGLQAVFAATNNTVALNALQHAHLVRRWSAASGDPALHPEQVIELWKVDQPDATDRQLLTTSAAAITSRFAQDGAYVAEDGTVTSEAQGYALLRAVWSGDRAGFGQTWQWTQAHLQDPDGLFAWQWQGDAVLDHNTASDADTDIALALLLAGRRWNDPTLIAAGRRTAAAIWANEVTTVNGVPYLTAGNWAPQSPVIALNPS